MRNGVCNVLQPTFSLAHTISTCLIVRTSECPKCDSRGPAAHEMGPMQGPYNRLNKPGFWLEVYMYICNKNILHRVIGIVRNARRKLPRDSTMDPIVVSLVFKCLFECRCRCTR